MSTTKVALELPFLPDLTSIRSWLACLPKSERERCRILYQGLQALNAAKLGSALQFRALEEFRFVVFHKTRNLSATLLGKPLSMDDKSRKLAKLSVQFQAELAQGYHGLARRDDFCATFDTSEQARIVHRAFQSYGQYFLRTALTYESPSSSGWRKINELYKLAETLGLLQFVEYDPEFSSSSATSITDLYKRLLVFRHIAPNRLEQTDIQKVFDLLQESAGLIAFSPNRIEQEQGADNFAVDLTSSEYLKPIQASDKPQSENMRYLYFAPLAEKIMAQGRPDFPKENGFSEASLAHLVVRLGGIPAPDRERKGRSALLIHGFSGTIESMLKIESRMEMGAAVTELELLPLENHFTSGALDKTQKPRKVRESVVGEPIDIACEVYPTKFMGYYLLKPAKEKLPRGRFVALNTDNRLVQAGMICPGSKTNGDTIYVFQLLANEVSLVRAFADSLPKDGSSALLSGNEETGYALIASPAKIRVGEALDIVLDGRRLGYRVAKILESADEFLHVELLSAETLANNAAPAPVDDSYPGN